MFTSRKDVIEAINGEVQSVRRNLDVLAIAGMDFFLVPNNTILSTIESLIRDDEAPGLHVRVLLLDPRGASCELSSSHLS